MYYKLVNLHTVILMTVQSICGVLRWSMVAQLDHIVIVPCHPYNTL